MLLLALVTQTLAPSNAAPLIGKVPTANVFERGPPCSLTRNLVSVLLPAFATQILTPSNPMPFGNVPTVNVPRTSPSLALNWLSGRAVDRFRADFRKIIDY